MNLQTDTFTLLPDGLKLYDADRPGLSPVATCSYNAVADKIAKRCNAFQQLVAFVRELSEAQEPTDVASYIESARALLASIA